MKALLLMFLTAAATRAVQNCRKNSFRAFKLRLNMISEARSLEEIASTDNSFKKFLKRDGSKEIVDGSKIHSRQITNAHYTCVLPEKVKSPFLIAVSPSCLDSLNIAQEESTRPEFVQYFVGNQLIPGMNDPYTTVYGTHSGGHWFGQMGDGRAIYLGETVVLQGQPEDDPDYYALRLRELQLKGAGRSPFSRGFDGRAVLRSSIREYLVSEAMHHLGVPTTRALSLIGTSQAVRRPWYAATSQSNPYGSSGISIERKFPPDTMLIEPGAIVCRVSRSFLRFGHLEIFGHRKEFPELIQMADYMCLREYPHLLGLPKDIAATTLPATITPGPLSRYILLFREITKRVAYLVAQWLRVGYVQGNMNTDNTLIGGRTMDYGPFGWMEVYNPHYQPFTSDSAGQFSFIRQPQAMKTNLQSLASSAFLPLLKYVATSVYPEEASSLASSQEELRRIVDQEYDVYFQRYYQEVQGSKLGLASYRPGEDDVLWRDLLSLMAR